MITQERLKELFDYDGEHLIRKTKSGPTVKIGDVAGYINCEGYRKVRADGKQMPAHRLIWVYVYGELPPDEIDHINHIKHDNRIENLRAVTHKENQQNISIPKDNTSGVVGVCWHKAAAKWESAIKVSGKDIHLGIFADFFDAVCARKSAENKYGFHPNHGRAA